MTASVAEGKLCCGTVLCILGVIIEPSLLEFRCTPAPDKVHRWIALLDKAMLRLMPGDAGKLAGKLSWGCSSLDALQKVGQSHAEV